MHFFFSLGGSKTHLLLWRSLHRIRHYYKCMLRHGHKWYLGASASSVPETKLPSVALPRKKKSVFEKWCSLNLQIHSQIFHPISMTHDRLVLKQSSDDKSVISLGQGWTNHSFLTDWHYILQWQTESAIKHYLVYLWNKLIVWELLTLDSHNWIQWWRLKRQSVNLYVCWWLTKSFGWEISKIQLLVLSGKA